MIFFDFEVFKYYWLAVIIDMTSQKTYFIEDRETLRNFYEQNKNNIWCGYNAKGYDQYILKGILLGFNPYKINNHIIVDNQPGWAFSDTFRKIPLNVYDCIVKRGGAFVSLKELEGHMGLNIRESQVSFNLDRPLTDAEKEEVKDYCKTDVENTVRVLLNTKKSFDSTLGLIKMYDLPLSYMSKTDGQLSAIVLGANRVHGRQDEFNIRLPETLHLSKYKHIAEWYLNPVNQMYDKEQNVKVYGVDHIFAWGGVHAAIPNYKGEGLYIMSDVASLYPSLMIIYELLSRNVSDKSKYKEIKDLRIKLKKEKNPLQEALKLVLNTTYGIMKDRNNNMYDPLMANLVCVFGQMLLLDLIEKIELKFGNNVELIQSNTDGILIKLSDAALYDEYLEVCNEWSKRTMLDLEHDKYEAIYQKDVNNYCIIAEDGHYKTKGAYVKEISIDNMDYDLPIVNKALIEYFTKGIPVEDTINSCHRLIEFQKVVKVSSKYLYATHGNNRLNEKCLRVFASKDISDYGVFKFKEGKSKGEKIANTPSRCFIDNSDITNKRIPKKLDKKWYIDLATSRLNDYLGADYNQISLW